jgi:hypothetical protein
LVGSEAGTGWPRQKTDTGYWIVCASERSLVREMPFFVLLVGSFVVIGSGVIVRIVFVASSRPKSDTPVLLWILLFLFLPLLLPIGFLQHGLGKNLSPAVRAHRRPRPQPLEHAIQMKVVFAVLALRVADSFSHLDVLDANGTAGGVITIRGGG